MELQKDVDADETPFEDLAERVRGNRKADDLGEALSEGATEEDDFYRGGSAEADVDEGEDPGDAKVTTQKSEPAADEPVMDIDTIAAENGDGVSPAEKGVAGEDPLEQLINPEDDRLDPRDARRVGETVEEYVVPKANYCEGCPYFSDPPDVSCTNDGSEIVAFEDMNHVLVRNCPKVDEERIASNED